MPSTPTGDRGGGAERGLARAIATIVLLGVGLGLSFNQLGLSSTPSWGLAWIGRDRTETLAALDEVARADGNPVPAPAGGYTATDDPMAVGLGAEPADLPEIPVLDRPIRVEIDAVKRLIDAGAAVVVDARDPDEFAAGHLPGALSLPYEEVSSEPERLERLETGGRPIVIYCGGGACEVSLELAWDLIYAGHRRVVVYMGGFPEWEAAGHAVETGPSAAG